jgi:hypothetical protein
VRERGGAQSVGYGVRTNLLALAPKGEETQKPVTDIRSPQIWVCCGGPKSFCNWSMRDSHVPIGMQTGNIHTSGKQVCLPSVDKDRSHDAVHSRFITWRQAGIRKLDSARSRHISLSRSVTSKGESRADPFTLYRRGMISLICKNEEVIKKILKHLGLWEVKARPPPEPIGPPKVPEYSIEYSHRGVGPYGPEAVSQVPGSDKWLYVDPVYPEFFHP